MKKNILLLSTVAVAVIIAGIYASQNLGNHAPANAPSSSDYDKSSTATASPESQPSPNAAEDTTVVATYNNGTPITKSALNAKLRSLFNGKMPEDKTDFSEFPKEVQENFIRGYVTSKLITEEAQKTGLENSGAFKEQLADMKEQLLQKLFILEKIKELAPETAVRERYDAFVKEQSQKEEIKARHILVSTEKEANEITEELKKGGNFEEIAKKRSADSSKDKGGDLGYFSRGQMVKSFEDAAFALKVGEVSAPIKSDFGWHIIKVEDRRKMAVPSYEEMKEKLQTDIGQKAVQDYISTLQNNAHIEYKLAPAPTETTK